MSFTSKRIGTPPSPPETDRESTDSGTEQTDSETVSHRKPSRTTRRYPLPPKHKLDNVVLPEDLDTPDQHVVRDPRLIRLTGIHPFNVEAPLSDLFDEGFLTSQDLHFVRNHGAVPKIDDDDADIMDWEFTIEGLVDNPIRISLAHLIEEYEQYTYPVTLVCAGNRRKEQNIVRKTKGFSWGAAGLSTALWTGVPLGDLLKTVMPRRGARYVCFQGADKLPNGYYGTSIKLSWAIDPQRGVMIAQKMNGEVLPYDHGKPVRVIIPGQIGGRSVKWLKKIIITDKPSDNWYHIYDNRVLPTMIDPEMSAGLPEVWKDERHAIYDLNTNSAICYPAHNEELSVNTAQGAIYTAKGYAYAGGGKRISRVEVTLDKGKTWLLAKVSCPEDDYRLAPEGEVLFGGKVDMSWRDTCFCWCFWYLEIPLPQLRVSDDIMVRAMDEAMMVQPRDMYWSVLGMMNNPWFRVVVHHEGDRLRFEHPTQPALMPGGWMERVKKAGGDLMNGSWGETLRGEVDASHSTRPAVKEVGLVNDEVNRKITFEELEAHDGETEPWFVVNGEVYDGTEYLEEHPGGQVSITSVAGQDASDEFLGIHSETAKAMLAKYHIGTLDTESARTKGQPTGGDPKSQAPQSPKPIFLDPKSWKQSRLVSKKAISHDTKIFTFALEHADQALGLPVGQHVLLRLKDPLTHDVVVRAYTPISQSETRGIIEVLVKIYPRSSTSTSSMTQSLDALCMDETIAIKGPAGKYNFEHVRRGIVTRSAPMPASKQQPKQQVPYRRLVGVCAGSGITPILSVLGRVMQADHHMKENLNHDAAPPSFTLIYANRTEADILCRAELDAFFSGPAITTIAQQDAPQRYRARHILSRYSANEPDTGTKTDASWPGATGRLSEAFVAKEVGAPREGDLILVCGPKGFEESVRTIFSRLGWDDGDMVFF